MFNLQITNTTTKILWESLTKIYDDESLANEIYLRRQLYNLKINDSLSTYEHFNEFNTLFNDLLGIGMKINEEEHATLLLCSMSYVWDNLIINISYVIKFDMNYVMTSLLSK